MKTEESFIHALNYKWLTPLYDPLVAFTIRESTFKPHLVKQAAILDGHNVLDVGCGTATLTLLIKQMHPAAEVSGIDADPEILERARQKSKQTGLPITLDQGMSYQLPYPDGNFDRVLSSLLFHHLTRKRKLDTLKEIHRVLRPEGELHVADWGKASNKAMRAAFLLVQMLDGFKTTMDNVRGLLPVLMEEAGFVEVQETTRFVTVFGTLSLYRARKKSRAAI
jgi:ubiquinone/menaquinone biosynthesis C-methylase UbiE